MLINKIKYLSEATKNIAIINQKMIKLINKSFKLIKKVDNKQNYIFNL